MRSVNVTDFRQNLQGYLSEVQNGRGLQVTLRGRVIATVMPPAVEADAVSRALSLLRDSVISENLDPSAPAVDPKSWSINR